MKLRWMPQARADLRAIYEFIAEDSPQNATRMIERLLDRAEGVVDFPRSGRMVPEYHQEDIREIIETPYRIIYRTLENRIDVLTVMHGARLLRDVPGIKPT